MESFSPNIIIRYIIVGLALFIVYFLPIQFLGDVGSWCVHYSVLGVQCPLCGMTHAAYHLAHLNFITAIAFNFNVLFLPLLVVTDILWVWKKQFIFLRVRNLVLMLLLCGLGLIYIIRLYTYFTT